MRIVAAAVVVALLLPSSAVAGPILESAERIANRMVPASIEAQAVGCAQATANGADLADRREGSAGYLVGGIFIPVIMPLIGMVSSPSPPAADIQSVDDDDLACFQDGYRDRGRSKKVRGGWIGTGISIAFYAVVIAAAAAEVDDRYPF